jgi:hypothetical protein
MAAMLSPRRVETDFVPTIPAERPEFAQAVSIREATLADSPAIDALASLDSSRRPHGRLLVAEVDGSVVAALPIDGGRAIADPFRRTSGLLALLATRATQLR